MVAKLKEGHMSLRKRIALAVIWVASIVATGAWATAQAPSPSSPPVQLPTIISGNDVGFRVESLRGNTPVGTLVIRINGQWVDAEFGVGLKRLTAK
jgi:hypothetical protein